MKISLRAKGLLALGVLVVYGVLTAWFLTSERGRLSFVVEEIDTYHTAQTMLEPAFDALAHALFETRAIVNSPDYSPGPSPSYAQIAASLRPLMLHLYRLRDTDPVLAQGINRLVTAVESVRAVPSGVNVVELRDAEQVLMTRLGSIVNSLQRRQDALALEYRHTQQRISATAVATSIAGALATAAVILIFFTRLARDLERLQERAVAIVSGYSGAPLANRRRDEVGGLIDAVNRMQSELRRWEQQQEVTRQQRFHQEKMAAVGSMAAAIGHEVSNPIAAIAGIAQFLIDETRAEGDGIGKVAHDFGVQILQQTERISLIMRQLANVTRPHSPEPELLDLNALIQSTCGFIAYDKRFRGVEFEHDFDHGLPAVTVVADHITQVLMNLLINAADAMDHLPKDGRARIRISTGVAGDEIRLAIADTGHGMSPEVMARAFEESFTTKPAGKGRGIGLSLCKALMEQEGGRIELASTIDVGTTVSLFLPVPPVDRTGG